MTEQAPADPCDSCKGSGTELEWFDAGGVQDCRLVGCSACSGSGTK